MPPAGVIRKVEHVLIGCRQVLTHGKTLGMLEKPCLGGFSGRHWGKNGIVVKRPAAIGSRNIFFSAAVSRLTVAAAAPARRRAAWYCWRCPVVIVSAVIASKNVRRFFTRPPAVSGVRVP